MRKIRMHRAWLQAIWLPLILALGWPAPLPAAVTAGTGLEPPDPVAARFVPFQVLLDRYLVEESRHGGLVSAFDYGAALADPEWSALRAAQRQQLRAFDPAALQVRAEAIAFWINAYNWFMIDQILSERPGGQLVDSVRDYGSWIRPYRVFSLELFEVGGRRYSLDAIEKEILLGKDYRQRGWKDARVHFAVNCASVGCPPLRARVYAAGAIDAMLDESTRLALRTPRHLRIEGDTLWLSRLFDWYAQDYVEAAGSVRAFVRRFLDPDRHAGLDATRRIRFIDYDWALNSPANIPVPAEP